MKEFFGELFDLLSSCVLIICLVFASFLFIINVYHYKEIRYNQVISMNESADYKEYKDILKSVDKKMKSVNVNNVNYGSTAKPIYDYYQTCINQLNKGTFSTFESKSSVNTLDIYKANDDILKKYNKSCVFGIPYNITVISKSYKLGTSAQKMYNITEQKRQIVIDNADYLAKSGLGNSAYSFSTDTTRSGVYNKLLNETKLTVNNYRMMASILDDVANWYVNEFGGNR